MTDRTEIQRDMARRVTEIYKDFTGRGPTRAKATMTEEAAIVLLHDSLTKAERGLIADGKEEMVRHVRREFQLSMADELKSAVAEITSREVKLLLSDHNPYEDVAAELFVFEE